MDTTQHSRGVETPLEFAQRNGLVFQDMRLLTRALTHRSYRNENQDALEDNERLEFLGDAVLDFLVGAWLYEQFPEMAEGDLTRMRSALVRTETLAQFAGTVELGRAMRLGRGEDDGGGRTREALLCATFEALVGALFLDGGIPRVQAFVEPYLHSASREIVGTGKEQDPKSLFQEWAQSNGHEHPVYRTVAAHGPDHDKIFEVEVLVDNDVCGRGEGHSKQAAAKAAARAALLAMGIHPQG